MSKRKGTPQADPLSEKEILELIEYERSASRRERSAMAQIFNAAGGDLEGNAAYVRIQTEQLERADRIQGLITQLRDLQEANRIAEADPHVKALQAVVDDVQNAFGQFDDLSYRELGPFFAHLEAILQQGGSSANRLRILAFDQALQNQYADLVAWLKRSRSVYISPPK